jgi:hypothetical protein
MACSSTTRGNDASEEKQTLNWPIGASRCVGWPLVSQYSTGSTLESK